MKIADPLLMREINKYHVLETIRCHGQISRVEISERTLLSGTTVSAITGALIEQGLIHATHTEVNGESHRGRPRVLLGLVADAAYVLGIKISEATTTVTLIDFQGEVVTSVQLPIRLSRQPVEVIADLIEDAMDDCINKSGVDRKRIRGIGIGVPGLVDPRSGRSYSSSVFGEREVPLSALLGERTGLPVKLEKPANLLALAEAWFGYAQRDKSFGVVVLDQTASLGIWLEDDVHRGASTLGPTFGHLKVGSEGIACDCGQVDCLNAHISEAALRQKAGETFGPDFLQTPLARTSILAALSEACDAGLHGAQGLIDGYGTKLGIGVSHVINLINPQKIIVVLDSPRFCELVEPAFIAATSANSFRAHFASTELIMHALDDQLWARGAAALMLRDIYSAPWTSAYQEEQQ
ncbi:ROK family transcriptional regulator [Devosia lucknowensis]|uniref:ROK family transcriptional regulator n=1 Tax=Devosia lucknowensis TaxID=1096929 RepID=UPI0011201A39|nr:ROK family transcriptional regulator [Devosia lucknowensis]